MIGSYGGQVNAVTLCTDHGTNLGAEGNELQTLMLYQEIENSQWVTYLALVKHL